MLFDSHLQTFYIPELDPVPKYTVSRSSVLKLRNGYVTYKNSLLPICYFQFCLGRLPICFEIHEYVMIVENLHIVD